VRPTLVASRNLLILALALVGLRLLFGLAPIEQALQKVVSPISSAIDTAFFADRTEIDGQANYREQLESLKNENAELRNELGFAEDFVVAEVIKKDVTGFRKSFLLNKGESSGVKVGQAVIFDDFLVGKIQRVTSGTALVQLITDPDFKVTASTESNEGGVVRNDSGSLIFDLVPGTDLTGKQIKTDGIDGQISAGVAIGTLGQRISSDNKTFHAYHLLLPVSLNQVDVVKIEIAEHQ